MTRTRRRFANRAVSRCSPTMARPVLSPRPADKGASISEAFGIRGLLAGKPEAELLGRPWRKRVLPAPLSGCHGPRGLGALRSWLSWASSEGAARTGRLSPGHALEANPISARTLGVWREARPAENAVTTGSSMAFEAVRHMEEGPDGPAHPMRPGRRLHYEKPCRPASPQSIIASGRVGLSGSRQTIRRLAAIAFMAARAELSGERIGPPAQRRLRWHGLRASTPVWSRGAGAVLSGSLRSGREGGYGQEEARPMQTYFSSVASSVITVKRVASEPVPLWSARQ